MQLHLYNTLSRSKELFVPINPDLVTIYSCGPTVYSRQHVGNLRAAFVVDLLKNVVKHIAWYPTKHVMNITDVWHLTGDNEGDADHGEDRMEKGARKEGITARDVAANITQIYMEDLHTLRIDPLDVMPRATDHIPEQISMIQELESKGYTYAIDGDGVYMDTSKIKDYGKLLSAKHLAGLESWARINDAGKRNPTDFALWKFNITGKKRDMERDSPRWVGFPGRHIECSAMSMRYLWTHIDIHTWGMEHIPIHHTNEICQSECSHGHQPRVNVRVHYQRLMMNGKKIAKSDGNCAYLDDEFTSRGLAWEDLRYFFLQAHYRSFQDFTREGLEAAKKSRQNLKKLFAPYLEVQAASSYQEDISYLTELLLDDLNTPQMIARLRAGADALDTALASAIRWLDEHVLKLWLFDLTPTLSYEERGISAEIQDLAAQRRQARLSKDRAKADALRDELKVLGYEMNDGKEGYEVVKIF